MMNPQNKQLTHIGAVESVDFPGLETSQVRARIDTGARTSSIWAHSAQEKDGVLSVVFFGPESKHFTSKVYTFDTYEIAEIKNSTGHVQWRYKVYLSVRLGGKRVLGRFSLADRSTQVYPVLVGRNVLRGKFIVDVKASRARAERNQSESQPGAQLDNPSETNE